MANHQIGKSVPRKEGREKVTGTARYVDDLTFPEMIHGAKITTQVVANDAKVTVASVLTPREIRIETPRLPSGKYGN